MSQLHLWLGDGGHWQSLGKSASAGNRTRVTSMAMMYSTTRPLMLLAQFWHRVYIIVFVLSLVFQEDLRLMEQNSGLASYGFVHNGLRGMTTDGHRPCWNHAGRTRNPARHDGAHAMQSARHVMTHSTPHPPLHSHSMPGTCLPSHT